MADFVDVDHQLTQLLYRLGPVTLRRAMWAIARYLRESNANRIRGQKNADGSDYQARKKPGDKRPQLTRYAKRIRMKVQFDEARVGIFGRMGRFGYVHSAGKRERGIQYPERNLLTLPEHDKTRVLAILHDYAGGRA